jgi:hypothetical protein
VPKADPSFFFHPRLSLVSVFLILFITNNSLAQTISDQPVRKNLTTADFKGKPDDTVDNLAQTYPLISIVYHGPFDCAEKGKVQVKVETRISVGPKSWINLPKIRSQEKLKALLSHEQGHYDMGAVLAVEIKRTLSGICFDKNLYQKQVDSVLKSMYRSYDSLQRKYDVDTDLMHDEEGQAKWKEKIDIMLKNGRLR